MTTAICPTKLRLFLDYDPSSGGFCWKHRTRFWFKSDVAWKIFCKRYANKPAFTAKTSGYHHGSIGGVFVRAHRAAWAIFYSEDPGPIVDHINGVRSDNRIENLRKATAAQNSQNALTRSDNKSGYKGVFEVNGTWHAQIKKENTPSTYLGSFKTAADAARAYDKAAIACFGRFACTNFGGRCG